MIFCGCIFPVTLVICMDHLLYEQRRADALRNKIRTGQAVAEVRSPQELFESDQKIADEKEWDRCRCRNQEKEKFIFILPDELQLEEQEAEEERRARASARAESAAQKQRKSRRHARCTESQRAGENQTSRSSTTRLQMCTHLRRIYIHELLCSRGNKSS